MLLRSGLANLRMWDALVAALAPRYRVIRYDLPGFGKSATPAAEFSTRADLAGLLRALGVERAHLVGSSLAVADALERGVTGARKVVFPGVAHLINLEVPERFSQVVGEFLDSLPESRAG